MSTITIPSRFAKHATCPLPLQDCLKGMGIQILRVDENENWEAVLPEKWKVERVVRGTASLIDSMNCERLILYSRDPRKGKQFTEIMCRFQVGNVGESPEDAYYQCGVRDNETKQILFKVELGGHLKSGLYDLEKEKMLAEPCYRWLELCFPNWKNPLAYWHEELSLPPH